MNYKIALIFVLCLPLIYAQTEVESQVNLPFVVYFDDSVLDQGKIKYESNNLFFTVNSKTLILNLDSFNYSKYIMNEISETYKPTEILLLITENNPQIIFKTSSNDILSIKQIEKGETKVYYGLPENLPEKKEPLLFIVEHYDPDKKMDDISRQDGTPRFNVVIKNNPKTEIDSSGLNIRTDGLKINRDSFLDPGLFESREVDEIGENSITEIFGYLKSLIIRISTRFDFDDEYDRGFKVEGETELPALYLDLSQQYVDITPESCSKFGFYFEDKIDLNYINETNAFTKKAWILLSVYPENNSDYLYSLSEFIGNSIESDITPILKIIGYNSTSETEEVVSIEKTGEFIKQIRNITNNKIKYFQILDKPNVGFEKREPIEPEIYAEYVVNISKMFKETDVKIISATIELGKSETLENKKRKNANSYIDSIFDNPEFLESINYIGSDLEISENQDSYNCIKASQILFYSGETYCMDSIYSYRWILEKVKEKTGKEFEVFLTEKTISDRKIIESLKEDPYIKSFTLNKEFWFTQDNLLNDDAKDMSRRVCGQQS